MKYRAKVPLTPRERLALEVYDRVDDAVRRELARLRREEGIVASCHRGCSRCCGQHIQMNPSEAHAMGQYIKRTFSGRQIRDLERRTEQWQAREDAQRKRHSSSAGSCGAGPSDDGLSCPLLVGRACSAYPVRPVICRTHFVSSDPSACLPACAESPDGAVPKRPHERSNRAVSYPHRHPYACCSAIANARRRRDTGIRTTCDRAHGQAVGAKAQGRYRSVRDRFLPVHHASAALAGDRNELAVRHRLR